MYTDWTTIGLGIVLIQNDDIGWKYKIAFAFRSNINVKSNYSSYKWKDLTAVSTIAHFWQYLYAQYFILVIKHQPLKSLIIEWLVLT